MPLHRETWVWKNRTTDTKFYFYRNGEQTFSVLFLELSETALQMTDVRTGTIWICTKGRK